MSNDKIKADQLTPLQALTALEEGRRVRREGTVKGSYYKKTEDGRIYQFSPHAGYLGCIDRFNLTVTYELVAEELTLQECLEKDGIYIQVYSTRAIRVSHNGAEISSVFHNSGKWTSHRTVLAEHLNPDARFEKVEG